MPKSLRKRAGANTLLVLLSIFLFLMLISSVSAAGPLRYGDVNEDGVINVFDVTMVMRHVLEIEELDERQLELADVNLDGVVNVLDVNKIMRFALELEEAPIFEKGISAVKAITPYKLLIEFNMEVEELGRADVDLLDEDGARLFVRRVELDDDGESAEVSLFSALNDEEEYEITITIDDQEFEYTFLYEQGEVEKFELEATDLVAASNQDFEVEYKLMTDKDVDVSPIKDVDVSANIPSGQIDAEGGIVAIDGQDHGTVVLFRLFYDNDEEIESDRCRVLFADEYVDEFGDFTIAAHSYWEHAIDWDENDLIQWLNVKMDDYYLVPQLIDQYGDDVTVSEDTLRFTSYDPDRLIVDRIDGSLTPRAEGDADIRVEYPDRRLSEVYTVEVLPEVELSDLVFADRGDDLEKAQIFNEIALSTIDDEMVVYVWLLDQYDRPYAPAEEVSFDIEVDDEDVVTTNIDSAAVEDDTNFALELNAGEEGDTVIVVENGDLSAELYVEVFEPGPLDDYEIRGVTDLDLYVNDVTNEMSVSVYGIDEDGIRTGPAESANWELNGDELFLSREVVTISTVDEDADFYIDEEDTYTIKAKIGDYTVEETFEVTDSTPPFRVLQVSAKETVEQKPGNVHEAIDEALEVTQNDVEFDIEDAKFISDNRRVIEDNADTSEKPGEATLYITELTVNGKTLEVDVTLDVVVEYEQQVNAGNSEAEAEDNEDGSATVTITVRDDYDDPMEGFDMDEIELRLYGDPDRVEIEWKTLADLHDRINYTAEDFAEETSGVYTVTITCTADWDGQMDVRVDDVGIETGADFVLTGN